MNNILGRIIKKKNKIITIYIKKGKTIPIYKKRIFYYSKIKAYDIYNEGKLGDFVLIKKIRPLTKTIFWILSKILEKVRLL